MRHDFGIGRARRREGGRREFPQETESVGFNWEVAVYTVTRFDDGWRKPTRIVEVAITANEYPPVRR